jgi:hypothetical protein
MALRAKGQGFDCRANLGKMIMTILVTGGSGPDVIDGASAARMWSEKTGRAVRYAGDDLANWEQMMRGYMPQWMVYDICLMLDRFQRAGLAASTGDTSRLESILGRPLHRYSDFVAETSRAWLSTTS